MSDVNFYFEYRNTQAVHLPVNPEKLEISSPGKNSTVNVIALGEVSNLKFPGLRTISFESFIPTDVTGAYVQANAPKYNSQFYIDFFNAVKSSKEPLNFTVTGLGVSIEVSVEDFSYWWNGSDPDMHYKLSLKEYKEAKMKTVEIAPRSNSSQGNTAVQKSARKNVSKTVAVGSKVIVNGQLHRDSYGAGPGAIEKNATRKVNFIKKGRKCPYHVTTLSGGWRGWVTESSVEVVE